MSDTLNPTPEISGVTALNIEISDKDSAIDIGDKVAVNYEKYEKIVVTFGDVDKEFEIADFLQRLGF